MECWLRFPKALNLEWDQCVAVDSPEEWKNIIEASRPISSILWPTEKLFPIIPVSPKPFFRRSHPHERNYRNNPSRNRSYGEAASRLAQKIAERFGGDKILVYAPLRGALPIWKTVSHFMHRLGIPDVQVYYPVTSSFVFYPVEYGIKNRKGKPASGRFTHILEMKRLKPFLGEYRYLLYIDEIVSGGMMSGHAKDMIEMRIHNHIKIIAAGIADAFGERSVLKRNQLEKMKEEGFLYDFLWEGCLQLITEDQKFLLGLHYVDYGMGPHVVPVLTNELVDYEEKVLFEREVCF